MIDMDITGLLIAIVIIGIILGLLVGIPVGCVMDKNNSTEIVKNNITKMSNDVKSESVKPLNEEMIRKIIKEELEKGE